MLVTSFEGKTLHLVHSYKLPKDGKYHHGIKHFSITLTDPEKSIVEQEWDDEEMKAVIAEADLVEVRRLR